MKKTKISLLIVGLFTHTYSFADTEIDAPEVQVIEKKVSPLPTLSGQEVNRSSAGGFGVNNSDTAALLDNIPGVNTYSAGGVSSLPTIHGLADDRLRIKVDGMDLIASCPNHMNSPLSYTTPNNLSSLKVYTGVAPVSLGGDSIGGVIIANTKEPEFAAPGAAMITKGNLGTFYRSNGDSWGLNAGVSFATDNLSFSYAGSTAESKNYKAGGGYRKFTVIDNTSQSSNLSVNEVGSTAYKTRNHQINLALKGDDRLLEAKISYQDIPYELYPNQRMDMLDNQQTRFSLRYLANYNWGNLEARAYHEKVDHFMDFGKDKIYNYGSLLNTYPVNGMPMYTKGKTDGASVKAEFIQSEKNLIRSGLELQRYRLDDWWPPAPDCGYTNGVANCTGGMAPNTFWNINNGQRDRAAIFGELETKWTTEWKSLLGLRYEHVSADTGNIQGYNSTMYTTSSLGTLAQFNSANLKRNNDNVDVSALANFTPDQEKTFEFGYSRKVRSPNLYERYSWSRSAMALEMNNFVGDGNGYLGNPDLKPETAHTLSAIGDWHAENRSWEVKVSPYFTYIDNYIDAVQWDRTNNVAYTTQQSNFVVLKYQNQSARIWGADISAKMALTQNSFGDWGLRGFVSYLDAKNLDTGSGLYNRMPPNGKLALSHKLGDWESAFEIVGVQSKDDVSTPRNEIKTPGYGLLNFKTSYTWKNIRFDAGVDNILDKLYYLPLGGAYTGEGATMSLNKEAGSIAYAMPNGQGSYGLSGTTSMWGTQVPGMGRSAFVGVNISF